MTSEVQALKDKSQFSPVHHGGISPAGLEVLQQQNDAYAKERNALKIILEKKIKTLVDAIAAAGAESRNPSREVYTLQKLVSSTISALKT